MNQTNFQKLLTDQSILFNSDQTLTIKKVNILSNSHFIDLSNISLELSNNKTYNLLTSFNKNKICFINNSITKIINSIIEDSQIKNDQNLKISKQTHKYSIENRLREKQIETNIIKCLSSLKDKSTTNQVD